MSIRGPDDVAQKTTPEALGVRVGSRRLRAGLIVSSRYVPGATPDLKAAGRGRALLCLIDNTVVVRTRPRFALGRLARIARDARILEGIRGGAPETAAFLLQRLAEIPE